MKTIRKVSSPEGFNIGMNQSAISGAGVAEHIHQHLVPRWSGDANFMPLIGQTKVMPFLLSQTRDELAAAW
jgi:ATP adenylyltransferase